MSSGHQGDLASGTRYQEIARHMRDELASGRYGAQGRVPSEAQLVRRFGVSRPTAARALRKLVEEGLVERRAGSGSFAKPPGATVHPDSTGVLALLIPDFGNIEILHPIGGEIASLARVNNCSLVWAASSQLHQPKVDPGMSLQHAEQLCRQFIDRHVSGVFFAPFEFVSEKEQANIRMATMLREAGIAVVLLDRDLTIFPRRSDFDLVDTDNFAGGYLLAEHLLKLGCRRLWFVAPPTIVSAVDARMAGARAALDRAGISPHRDWIKTGDFSDKSFLRTLLAQPRPDAYIASNDHTAAVLLQLLAQYSIRVPEDVRVVGFDDLKLASIVSPPLTTIHQPCHEIAPRAFRCMLERQSDPTLPPSHVSLTPRLIVRESCGAYLQRGK